MKVIILLSGGMDSTTLLYLMKETENEVKALTINYSQRHNKEILAAGKTCAGLGIPWIMLNLNDLKYVMKGSSLTDNIPVPEGRYDEEAMKQTVVPNRNMIFLSIAAAWSISLGYNAIAYAAHTGDHAIYPDCREEFFRSCETTINEGNWGDSIALLAPFISYNKTDILRLGQVLNVDYSLTWTCYKGDLMPCGKCGSCIERAEAFKKAGIIDPLEVKT